MPEFEVNTIEFTQDTEERRRWFRAASFSHPAKMVLGLQIYLIEHYTKPGETILDPMAGSGTVLVGCALGRNVVCVELEKKFVKMIEANWDKIKSLGPMLGYKMGEATILQGDARNLDDLLADKIITSPPYSDISMGGGLNTKPPRKGHNDQSGRNSTSHSQKGAGGYIDKIVTSPPFGVTEQRGGGLNKDPNFEAGCKWNGYSPNTDNIGNLPYGEISAVISSPPYEGSDVSQTHMTSNKRGDPKNPNYRPSWKDKIKDGYCETKRPYADAVITSPPYEGSLIGGGLNTKPSREGRNDQSGRSSNSPSQKGAGKYTNKNDLDPSIKRLRKHGRTDDKAGGPYGQSLGHPYSGAANNIGNLKSENYLEAMAQVYRQCHKVLKDGGLLCLVVKNFIRDKKLVRLDLDTIKLCEKAGFVLKERLKRKLLHQSFWRILYQKKFPDAPKIEFEDVLIFEKGV